jgi:nuclear transport factor 2 (NTF2) superfamily protein
VFDEAGKMSSRQMSGNTIAIKEDERWFTDENRIDVSRVVLLKRRKG